MVAPLASCDRKASRRRPRLGEGAGNVWRGHSCPRSRQSSLTLGLSPLSPHNLFNPLQILLRVDADAVERRFCHVDRYPAFEKAQLLQALAALERRLWPAHELRERVLAIAVEPKMFVVSRTHPIAVVRDSRPRKIQGAPRAIRH